MPSPAPAEPGAPRLGREACTLLTDAELLWATRLRSADAFSELYRRHEPAVRRFAGSLVRRDPHDADDLTAEAFSNLLRVLHRGAGPTDHPERYLKVSVRNAVAKRYRRTQVATSALRRLSPLVDGEHRPFSVEDPDLRAAFTSLPRRWREVIWWTEVEGWSAQEVARVLALSPNAAAALAYRARTGLRAAYEERRAGADPDGAPSDERGPAPTRGAATGRGRLSAPREVGPDRRARR